MWRDCARPVHSRRTDLLRLFLAGLAAGVWALSCGDGDPAGPDGGARHSEFELASAPPGLEAAIAADSLWWAPGVFRLRDDGGLEIDGTYLVVFRNRADRPLEVRYDLRFLDVDGIFVDQYIPFGLPLHLPADSVQASRGSFTIRSFDLDHPGQLTTMQVVATAADPGD